MKKLLQVVLVIMGLFIMSSSFFQSGPAKSIERGKEVYASYCQNCHMDDGKGMANVNPPVAKADYLKKPAKELIKIILEGQSGEIVVNKITYNGMMPAQSYLTDEQIADVLNYVRNSMGNKIPGTITPAQVKALR